MKIEDLIQLLALLPTLLKRLDALLHAAESAKKGDEDTPESLLNTKEMAAVLRIGQPELLHLARTGVLPAWEVGNGWRYSRRQVIAAFEAHASEAAARARQDALEEAQGE
ncbi:helix-turn-helix domain-containing protein [Deinococcus marmoris]|uniref:helix-turn-helix domain-containing protein n=1 Tax=Deinococcus marmoris TaxID=249408 RepID=UPI0004969505|nr:helix-turn-helix domain-containing protein [Deinococcus marmoris]